MTSTQGVRFWAQNNYNVYLFGMEPCTKNVLNSIFLHTFKAALKWMKSYCQNSECLDR